VIKARSRPPGFGEAFPAEQVDGWWEGWMRQVDQVLDDEDLVATVYEALVRRHPKSRTRGRWGTPAEIVLRMLVLKHVYNCSFEDLERQVRANLVYRQFTRVGAGKVPDAKALGRQAQALGPEVLQKIHGRVVEIARQNRIATGRKLRVDTTVVETNIHYPTDSSLLGDGVRVLTRVMKRVTDMAGEVGTKLRDRSRSVKLRAVEIARVSRSKSDEGQQRMKDLYGKVLEASGRVVRQAQQFANEIASGVKRSADFKKQAALEGMKKELETMLGRVKQVRRQARARVFGGNTHVEGKLASMFEPSTEIIRRGKAKQPTEFGKMIKVQEAEGQIIVDYEVFEKRPSDSDLLAPAIQIHQQRLGRVPDLVAADAAFYSAAGEKAAHQLGVKYVSVPNRSTKSKERKTLQKTRWFKKGQKWRTGCEGRISVLKRRHGLTRCRYRGDSGMKRWVGLGVISDNLINVGRALAIQTDKT
jgi:IS5 family transposase